jgi:hypothetical protein
MLSWHILVLLTTAFMHGKAAIDTLKQNNLLHSGTEVGSIHNTLLPPPLCCWRLWLLAGPLPASAHSATEIGITGTLDLC